MLEYLCNRIAIVARAMKPLAGHKNEGMRTCFRTYCECGWSSCAHWERREAYSEWRQHISEHGGVEEDRKDWVRRENRQRRKLGFEEVD